MFQLIEQLHIISTKNNLKLAPEKYIFMLLKVKFFGQEIGYNTIKPIHSKIAAIHKIPFPTGTVAFMSFIGALNFYTKINEKLHYNLQPFYELLHENTPWNWTDEYKILFQQLKTSELWNRTYHTKYKTSMFHFSRRFAYWIRRCSFPIE